MSAAREAEFLNGFLAVVVGNTAASDTVIAVLSALGAIVERTSSLQSDLSDADAVIVDRIAEGIDENYTAQVSAAMAEFLRVRAWVTVSGFGMDGPKSWYRGSEVVAAAAGCLLNAVRDRSGMAQPMPASQALRTVGQSAALAALHGLSLSRERGEVVHLDVSAQEAVAFASVQQELAHVIYNCPGSAGSARYAAPSRLFECTDGLLNIVVIDEHQFARVAELLGRQDWMENYPTLAERNQHADEINQAVAEWAGARTKAECEAILQANAVPATAIRTVAEAGVSEQFVDRQWSYEPATTTRTTGVLPALVERRARHAVPAEGRTLDDLHVVEVTNVLAGPLAGAIIAAMGATVLRLEDRDRLDIYRRTGPFADGEPGLERGAYFMAANYDKLSVSEKLRDPDTVSRIMTWGNVLLENVGWGRLARLGVDGSKLGGDDTGCAISVSGFGRSGPHSHYRAYAWNVHSYAGLSEAVTQYVGDEVAVRSALADYCSAMWAATFGAAWWLGGGTDAVRVDVSMAEVIASKLLPPEEHGLSDAPQGPNGRTNYVVRSGDDRFLAASAESARTILSALGAAEPGDGDDVRSAALLALTAAAAGNAEATVEALQKAGVAAYMAQTPASLLEDEQALARNAYPQVEHPVLGQCKVIALPWKVVGEPRNDYRAAPILGGSDADVEQMVRQ